jgi:hypothetical protein
MYMCGFTQSKRDTVPSTTISCGVSNIDWLWCAAAGAHRSALDWVLDLDLQGQLLRDTVWVLDRLARESR